MATEKFSSEIESVEQAHGVAKRLGEALTLRGMRQSELARGASISPGYVSELLNGHKWPNRRICLVFAKVLNVSDRWLLTGEGHPDDVDAKATPGLSSGNVDSGALSIDQVGKLLAAAERERLTPDERALLVKYQSLPPAQRARLWDLLNAGAADPPEPPARLLNDGETRKGKG